MVVRLAYPVPQSAHNTNVEFFFFILGVKNALIIFHNLFQFCSFLIWIRALQIIVDLFETLSCLQRTYFNSIYEIDDLVFFLMSNPSLVQFKVNSSIGFSKVSLQYCICCFLFIFVVKIFLFLYFVVYHQPLVNWYIHLTEELEYILPIKRIPFCNILA